MKTFVIGEIGINHNGDIENAKKLIKMAKNAGCNAVKFQKRSIDKVYSKEFLDSYRISPWGKCQRDQKKGLEFEQEEYNIIHNYCKEENIEWFASSWDLDSQLFLRQYDLRYNKVASAMLDNDELLKTIAEEKKITFISTGMSYYKEIDKAIGIFSEYNCPFIILHCNSSYPMAAGDANLKMIPRLKERYNCQVGYSGHEQGLLVSMLAVAMGATVLERHITLDKKMYGSDQKSSLDIKELEDLIDNIKLVESIMGDGEKKLSDNELAIRYKLRKAVMKNN